MMSLCSLLQKPVCGGGEPNTARLTPQRGWWIRVFLTEVYVGPLVDNGHLNQLRENVKGLGLKYEYTSILSKKY